MASTSETGHAKNVATFEDLISFCTGYGAQYNPSKAALKVPALNTLLAACNTAARDKALYGEGNGMVDVAKDVKLYIKSVFGASSPQFKQVSGLQFNKPKGD